MRLAFLLAAAIAVAAPAAASAETVVPVDKFTSVELHGGGSIIIKQGPVQRVTLVHGDPKVVTFRVTDRDQGGKLIISPCEGWCWGPNRLDVEIETPTLNGAGIHGGGQIIAEGPFPTQSAVSAAIHGGGVVDLRTVPSQTASASIHGGGRIFVAAQNSLAASIYGGGAIRYAGQPSVSSSIHGGGHVSPIN